MIFCVSLKIFLLLSIPGLLSKVYKLLTNQWLLTTSHRLVTNKFVPVYVLVYASLCRHLQACANRNNLLAAAAVVVFGQQKKLHTNTSFAQMCNNTDSVYKEWIALEMVSRLIILSSPEQQNYHVTHSDESGESTVTQSVKSTQKTLHTPSNRCRLMAIR